jgi:hypothetical protein
MILNRPFSLNLNSGPDEWAGDCTELIACTAEGLMPATNTPDATVFKKLRLSIFTIDYI